MFSAPPSQLLDPPLPPVPADPPAPDPEPATGPSSLLPEGVRRLFGRSPSPDGPPSPTDPSGADPASSAGTRTSTEGRPGWRAGGNPQEVGETLAGLLALLSGFLVLRAARRGRRFRAPDPAERDAIAFPVARILTRHLPMQAIGPDIKDAAQAARGLADYVQAGPLLTRSPELDEPTP